MNFTTALNSIPGKVLEVGPWPSAHLQYRYLLPLPHVVQLLEQLRLHGVAHLVVVVDHLGAESGKDPLAKVADDEVHDQEENCHVGPPHEEEGEERQFEVHGEVSRGVTSGIFRSSVFRQVSSYLSSPFLILLEKERKTTQDYNLQNPGRHSLHLLFVERSTEFFQEHYGLQDKDLCQILLN